MSTIAAKTTHLHAGWNLPGYLPESDVACFDSWDDAKRYMIDSMLQHTDSTASWADEHDCDDVPCPTYGDDCPESKATDLSNTAEELNLDDGPEWSAIAGDLSYWIVISDEQNCHEQDIDTSSSVSRQHYIDTGHYLTHAQASEGQTDSTESNDTTVLQLSWSTSRGRETHGYNIARLDDTTTGKRYRCMGGGYDMVGTVFAEWLQDVHQERVQAIADRAYYVRGPETANRRNESPDTFYGMRHDVGRGVYLDGACGLESMRHIAKTIGLEVRQIVSKRGSVTGFVVTDTRAELAERDAGLGVHHIWTATQCPTYRSLIGADCTCEA